MYNIIINPITNRKVNISSKLGINILNNYLIELKGGKTFYEYSKKCTKPIEPRCIIKNKYKYDKKLLGKTCSNHNKKGKEKSFREAKCRNQKNVVGKKICSWTVPDKHCELPCKFNLIEKWIDSDFDCNNKKINNWEKKCNHKRYMCKLNLKKSKGKGKGKGKSKGKGKGTGK